jgi:Carboxypeptidase regulatory-like domain
VGGRHFAYPLTFYPAATSPSEATPIDLGFGEDRSGVDVQLAPLATGAITGQLQGTGQIANLLVRLLLTPDLGIGFETALARSGVDGRFRFANVPAGHYTLEVPVRVNELRAWRPASTIEANRPPGAGTFNIREAMPSGAPAGTVLATLSPGGATLAGGRVTVTSDNATALSARAPVTVGSGTTVDAVVTLRAPATISGQIRIDGAGLVSGASWPSASISTVWVVADSAEGDPDRGEIGGFPVRNDPSGQFAVTDVPAGRYFLRIAHPSWRLKSVTVAGRDYTEQPFDVAASDHVSGVVLTVTGAAATVRGTVTAPDGAAVGDARIAVFPADPARWRDFGFEPPGMAETTSSQAGTYSIDTLPAGEYLVTVVPDRWRTQWRDAAFLSTAAATAVRIRLSWGQSLVQNLSMERR